MINLKSKSAFGFLKKKEKKRKEKKRKEKKRKENFKLFSDHYGSLLRRQPGAVTISHSPKGKEDYQI